MTARFRFIVTTPISRPFAQVTKLGLTTRTAALAPHAAGCRLRQYGCVPEIAARANAAGPRPNAVIGNLTALPTGFDLSGLVM